MMIADKAQAEKPKRGRPRSTSVRTLVLKTALDLLQEGDTRALTMENIAARARVSKATLYRWWSSPSAIAFESFLGAVTPHLDWDADGDLREVLTSQAVTLTKLFTSTIFGCTVRRVIADGQTNEELRLSFVDNFITPRRARGKEIIIEAQANGTLRSDVDPDVVLDLVFDPVYLRLLTSHAPLTESFARQVVDAVFRGLAIGS